MNTLEETYRTSKIKVKRLLSILIAWSVANIVIFGVFLPFSSGQYYYFAIMSIAWCVINLFIVVPGFISFKYMDEEKERKKELFNLYSIYLVNVVLNVLYIVMALVGIGYGLFISQSPDMVLGLSFAVIPQALFLEFLDVSAALWLYRAIRSHF